MVHSLCIPSPVKVPSDLDEIYLPLKLVLRASVGALLILAGPGLRFHARCPHDGYTHLLPSLWFWPSLHTAPPDSSLSSTFCGIIFTCPLFQVFLSWDSQLKVPVSPYFLQRGCIGWLAIPKMICQSPASEPVNVNLFENKIFANINKLQVFRWDHSGFRVGPKCNDGCIWDTAVRRVKTEAVIGVMQPQAREHPESPEA